MKLDRHEIQWVLKQNGQNLSPSEFERLFRYFDKNNDGFVNISEFIQGVRGELNGARAAVVKDVWSRIAPQGTLPANDFASAFNVSVHPDYCNGTKSKAAVLEELMEAVDFNQDGVISGEEFFDFYTNVSPVFGDDEQFKNMVLKAWGLY